MEREIGSNPPKSYNDIRKTNYDVKLTEDGKLDLYTHKKEKKRIMIKLGGIVDLKGWWSNNSY